MNFFFILQPNFLFLAVNNVSLRFPLSDPHDGYSQHT